MDEECHSNVACRVVLNDVISEHSHLLTDKLGSSNNENDTSSSNRSAENHVASWSAKEIVTHISKHTGKRPVREIA